MDTPYVAKKRTRNNLLYPGCPGGHLEDPPADCPHRGRYCPDPRKYMEIWVVSYTVCNYATEHSKSCTKKSICLIRKEADRMARKRISMQRNGVSKPTTTATENTVKEEQPEDEDWEESKN